MSLEKLARKAKKESGHLRPGTTAMIGALLGGPAGAAAGADIGRRGRATEGSPAIRAYVGSLLGVPAGALAGGAGGALLGALTNNPNLIKKLRISLGKRRLGKARKMSKGGLFSRMSKKRKDAIIGAKRDINNARWDLYFSRAGKRTAGERALVGGGIGALLGGVGGYFEGARRGAESVRYK